MHLASVWGAYANYNFGYAVPWIAALLAVRTFQASQGGAEAGFAARPARGGALVCMAAAAWGLFFFAELEREVDPHWRLVGWTMAGGATLLTAVALLHSGGAALLRRYAFPLAFLWTAVPWPSAWEDALTLNLRLLVTRLTTCGLHLTGIHAKQSGNVVELANGAVTVDSACSGISSLQCGIMACLFLGEFFRLGWKRRLFLVGAGSLVAVSFNLLRTYLLVRLANDSGADALFAHHDQLGYAETAAIFLSLMLLAWWLSLAPASVGPQSPPSTRADKARGATTAGYLSYGVLVAFAAMPLLAHLWFTISPGGPARVQTSPMWAVNLHPSDPAWKVRPIPLDPLDEVHAQLLGGTGPGGGGTGWPGCGGDPFFLADGHGDVAIGSYPREVHGRGWVAADRRVQRAEPARGEHRTARRVLPVRA